MTTRRALAVFALLSLTVTFSACDRDDGDRMPLQVTTNPVVFEDEIEDTIFEPFGESFYNQTPFRVASVNTYEGSAGAIRIDVDPPAGGVTASGGAFTAFTARDLRGYNVLSFQIKATADVTIGTIGFGEGNQATSIYQASRTNLAVGTEWQEVLLPIPDPSRLRAERGMLWFVDDVSGSDPAEGYSFFIDEIVWATRGDVNLTSAQIPSLETEAVFGTEIPLEPQGELPVARFDVQGTPVSMSCRAFYFDYFDAADTTDAPPVLEFTSGRPVVVGPGVADVRATLAGTEAGGSIRVQGIAPPTEEAPAPTFPAGDVISIFSDPYVDIAVDSFSPSFGAGNFFRVGVPGREVIAYTGLASNQSLFIDFGNSAFDVTNFDGFRVDVLLTATEDQPFVVAQVNDFGPDGVFTPFEDPDRDDSQGRIGRGVGDEIIPLGEWYTIEIPLTDFEEGDPSIGLQLDVLRGRTNIAQVGLQTNSSTIFLDNIIFYRGTSEGN